jgi:hypothetical protein
MKYWRVIPDSPSTILEGFVYQDDTNHEPSGYVAKVTRPDRFGTSLRREVVASRHASFDHAVQWVEQALRTHGETSFLKTVSNADQP